MVDNQQRRIGSREPKESTDAARLSACDYRDKIVDAHEDGTVAVIWATVSDCLAMPFKRQHLRCYSNIAVFLVHGELPAVSSW